MSALLFGYTSLDLARLISRVLMPNSYGNGSVVKVKLIFEVSGLRKIPIRSISFTRKFGLRGLGYFSSFSGIIYLRGYLFYPRGAS